MAFYVCLYKKEMHGVPYYHLDVFVKWIVP